jgi:hypothetical protein
MGSMTGFCKHGDETSGFIKVANFLICWENINFLKNGLYQR